MDSPPGQPTRFRFTADERMRLVAGWGRKRPAPSVERDFLDRVELTLSSSFDAQRKPIERLDQAALADAEDKIRMHVDALGKVLNRLPLRDWEGVGYGISAAAQRRNIAVSDAPLNDLVDLLNCLGEGVHDIGLPARKGPDVAFEHGILIGLVWDFKEAGGVITSPHDALFTSFLDALAGLLWPDSDRNPFGPKLLRRVLETFGNSHESQ